MAKVFVFGSNLAGRHGKGAALFAKQSRGAIYGQGIGRQGNSYAIPTKDERLKTLPIHQIKKHVDEFIEYAKTNPDLVFELTPIGCGLAGYEPEDIAPLFISTPNNVEIPETFIVPRALAMAKEASRTAAKFPFPEHMRS